MEQAGLLDKYLAAARPEGQDLRILDKDGSVLWEETESREMDRPEVCMLLCCAALCFPENAGNDTRGI